MGDLAHKADPDAYGLFAQIIAGLPMPVHLMIGNHDRRKLGTSLAVPARCHSDLPKTFRGLSSNADDGPSRSAARAAARHDRLSSVVSQLHRSRSPCTLTVMIVEVKNRRHVMNPGKRSAVWSMVRVAFVP